MQNVELRCIADFADRVKNLPQVGDKALAECSTVTPVGVKLGLCRLAASMAEALASGCLAFDPRLRSECPDSLKAGVPVAAPAGRASYRTAPALAVLRFSFIASQAASSAFAPRPRAAAPKP